MIPKIIHYCWFGGTPIPNNLKKLINSWKKICPDYEIKRWDESNFDIACHPFIKTAYEAKAWAFVSDYARLKIIYENGGIYLDTDVELLKKPDEFLKYQCYFGLQQVGQLCATGLGFGAVKGSHVIYEMLKEYDGLAFSLEKRELFVCPQLNSNVIFRMGYQPCNTPIEINDVLILPSKYLDPISPGNSEDLLCEETISIHHYTASWGNPKERWKRKLFLLIGQKRLNRLKALFKQKHTRKH